VKGGSNQWWSVWELNSDEAESSRLDKKRGGRRIEQENECACHCVLEKAQSGAKE